MLISDVVGFQDARGAPPRICMQSGPSLLPQLNRFSRRSVVAFYLSVLCLILCFLLFISHAARTYKTHEYNTTRIEPSLYSLLYSWVDYSHSLSPSLSRAGSTFISCATDLFHGGVGRGDTLLALRLIMFLQIVVVVLT